MYANARDSCNFKNQDTCIMVYQGHLINYNGHFRESGLFLRFIKTMCRPLKVLNGHFPSSFFRILHKQDQSFFIVNLMAGHDQTNFTLTIINHNACILGSATDLFPHKESYKSESDLEMDLFEICFQLTATLAIYFDGQQNCKTGHFNNKIRKQRRRKERSENLEK